MLCYNVAEMNKVKFDLTAQNKLIITGLLISTVVIVGVAFFAISKIQQKLYDSYGSFGQLLTKTLAIQTYELTKDTPKEYRYNLLRTHANSILTSNKDISFITFKDEKGKIIYTTADAYNRRAQDTRINISSPMTDSFGRIVGIAEIGLSADMASVVARTTKNSMLLVFTLVWIIFTIVIVVNTFLITRELTLLHHGVKEISNGRFGTVLDYKQSSGEIKELFSAFNDMSKRLHAYEEQNVDQLTLERNKLEAVLMSIANGVVVCDNYDKVSIVNPAAQKILSATAMELSGTSIQNYCDTNGEMCFKEKIAVFKDTPLDVMEKKPLEFNINVDNRVIKTLISPMYSKVHDYMGYIIILIDITKEAEVDKLKNDFISNVSHELRTPVTILTSYAETLYSYGKDFNYDEQKEFIGTINQEVIRLNKMVNDILDFSKLQNDVELEKTRQNIMPVIERSLEDHKILAEEKNITFSVIKEPGLPDIAFNEQSIERVLSNLITNAIKYSPDNSRVKIRAEIAKDPNYLEVTIEDMGMGIAPEYQEKIFDRFFRIENATHTIKGTGLGLHLVKIAIEKHHGGKVFVRSKVGEGSTFGFRLPLDAKATDENVQTPQDPEQIPVAVHKEAAGSENTQNTQETGAAKTVNEMPQNREEKVYEPAEISTVKDYETKAVQDAKFVDAPPPKPCEEEWEITFEVRDKKNNSE